MDKYFVKIKFNGKGWKKYDFILNDCEKKEVLHKDLKPADSSFRFSLLPDIELHNLLLAIGERDSPAQVFKNDQAYFFGFIRKNFNLIKEQRLKPVKIELVSAGYLLKEKIGHDVFIQTKKTVTETIKEILALTATVYKHLPEIPDLLYGVHLKADDNYHQILTNILFEYDYTFAFDAEGYMIFIPLFLEHPKKEYSLTGLDCLEAIQLEYKESKKTEICVEWDGVEIAKDNYAFKESAGAQMGYDCYFEITPEGFYKDGEHGVYIPYQSDFGEVAFAENVRLEFEGETDLEVLKFEAYNKKAFIHIKNTNNLFSRRVFKVNFKADTVFVKKSKNQSQATRNTTNNKAHILKTKYIYTKVRAENLAHKLLNYYTVTTLNYKIKSKKGIPLGCIVSISDDGIGEGVARIVEKKERVQEKTFDYIAEMVGDYQPATTKIAKELLPDPPKKGKDGKDGHNGKDGAKGDDGATVFFPHDLQLMTLATSDEIQPDRPTPDPAFSLWQDKIIEYDCTDKSEIIMSFDEALNDVIILGGQLKNDFILKLFFDSANANGAKNYLIVFKLQGEYLVKLTTGITNTRIVQHELNSESYGLGCFIVVDYSGNVFHFKGEKGNGGLGTIDTTNVFNDPDYFIIEQEKTACKISKTDGLNAIQQFDSPIGEIKEFYDNDYKHGFLECNGLPFSPAVFPELTDYVKRVFNTSSDTITGWQLRPTKQGSDGRTVYIKAVQGV